MTYHSDDEEERFKDSSREPDEQLADIIQSIKGDDYLEQTRRVSSLFATDGEIATFFRCSIRHIYHKKKNDPLFREAIEAGRNMGRMSLRRAQINLAMAGNPAMLIHLGKQFLNQTDQSFVDIDIEESLNPEERANRIFYATASGEISTQAGTSLSNISRTTADEEVIDALKRIGHLEKLVNGE